MKIERIHHVAIICTDYERTRRFYTETLGFEIVREVFTASNGAYKLDLAVGGAYQIEIFFFANRARPDGAPQAAILNHIALAVADIHGTARELAQLGIAVDEIRVDPHTGKHYTFFADPDGVPLELYEA